MALPSEQRQDNAYSRNGVHGSKPETTSSRGGFPFQALHVCAVDSEAIGNYHQLRLSQHQRMCLVAEGTNGEAAVIMQK